MRRDDLDALVASVDPVVVRWQGFPSEPAELREFLRPFAQDFRLDPYLEHFAITDGMTDEVLGVQSLYADQSMPGVYQTGGWLGGAWRGQGFGRQAVSALLEYARGHLDAIAFMAGTEDSNSAALRLYKGAGFRQVVRRPHTLPDSREISAVWMVTGSPRTWRKLRRGARTWQKVSGGG